MHHLPSSAPSITEIEIAIASTNIAISFEFHHLAVGDFHFTIFSIQTRKAVVVKRVFNQYILDITVSIDIAGETIVMDGEGSQSTIANGIILPRQSPAKVIVIQVETAKFHKLFGEVSRQSSGQLISANVKVFASAQPQFLGNRSSELIGVDIEIAC